MFRGKGDDLIWVIVGNESRKAGENRDYTVQLYCRVESCDQNKKEQKK